MISKDSKISTLYVCYQTIRDPLTYSQVVVYLEGLAMSGYRVFLLTFEKDLSDKEYLEKTRQELAEKNITWFYLKYHKRPTVPATLYDVAMGIRAGRKLVKKHDIKLIHARSHIPAMIGLGLKKLTGCKILIDYRGLIAEEYIDSGIWKKDGYIIRAFKWMERKNFNATDGVVVVTHKAKELLQTWYEKETVEKPFKIIPCCVDMRGGTFSFQDQTQSCNGDNYVYVGKLGGRYGDDYMVEFMTKILKDNPKSHWDIWTQSDSTELREKIKNEGLEDRVNFGFVPADQLKEKISSAKIGLSFTKPCLALKGISPAKIGEYLACGIPVVTTPGIGDVDELLTRKEENGESPVGVIYAPDDSGSFEECIQEIKKLMEDKTTPDRCRDVARKELDLETVGWTRYREIYQQLIGPANQP